MSIRTINVVMFSLVIFSLQGCAGKRDSYTSMLDESEKEAVLHVKKGEVREILAIADGFPGWWGYYPWVMTSSPDIADVKCRDARSFIPFRKPGVIFGGKVCDLVANKAGRATLFFGSKYGLSKDSYRQKVDVIISN